VIVLLVLVAVPSFKMPPPKPLALASAHRFAPSHSAT
jgi:hypothetical protein